MVGALARNCTAGMADNRRGRIRRRRVGGFSGRSPLHRPTSLSPHIVPVSD